MYSYGGVRGLAESLLRASYDPDLVAEVSVDMQNKETEVMDVKAWPNEDSILEHWNPLGCNISNEKHNLQVLGYGELSFQIQNSETGYRKRENSKFKIRKMVLLQLI